MLTNGVANGELWNGFSSFDLEFGIFVCRRRAWSEHGVAEQFKKSRMNVTSSQSEFQIRNLILKIFPQKCITSNDSPSLSVVRS